MSLLRHLIQLTLWSVSVAQQCPEGWTYFGESCYAYIRDPNTWIESQDLCKTFKARLAEIGSAEENTFLYHFLTTNNGGTVWIGLEDLVIEGMFVWSSTQQYPVYHHWAEGEPNNVNNLEDCVEFDTKRLGFWNDFGCDNKVHAICEKDANSETPVGK